MKYTVDTAGGQQVIVADGCEPKDGFVEFFDLNYVDLGFFGQFAARRMVALVNANSIVSIKPELQA